MKFKLSLFLVLSCSSTLIGQIVNVVNFGATPNDSLDDDANAIVSAIASCRGYTNPVLYFPLGTYHLNSANKGSIYFFINSINNLTIQGSGSTLKILGKNYMPHVFGFEYCENLNVQNIKIDYQDPPFSQGKIIQAGANFMDVQISDGFTTSGKKIEAYAQYDSIRGQMANANEHYGTTAWQWLDESNNIIKITSNYNGYTKGTWIVLRHTLYTGYSFFTSKGCKNVVFDSVTVFVSPGYAFLAAAGAENVSYLNCKIKAKENFWVTTCADGSHNSDARGTLKFDNCLFENMADDGINQHSYYLDVLSKRNDSTITVECLTAAFYDANGYRVGDTVEFINAYTLESIGYEIISNISNRSGNSRMTLQFQNTMPWLTNSLDMYKMANISAIGSLRVTNSTIRANRARGILVSTSDVIIENCTFERNLMNSILFSHSAGWNESMIAEDVILRNNVFDDCGYFQSDTISGVINFEAEIRSSIKSCNIFKNISIVENTFKNLQIPAVYARNVNQLEITNNIFSNANSKGNLIKFKSCNNTIIENNGNAVIENLGGDCNAVYICKSIPGKIEAEDYFISQGVFTATCTDTGGGLTVGWIDAGDWMEYNVCIDSGDTYNIECRVASLSVGGTFEIQDQNGNTIATVNVPVTGGWQNWKSVIKSSQLTTYITSLRIVVIKGGFNINWLDFSINDNPSLVNNITNNDFKIFPNPCNNEFNILSNILEDSYLSISDLTGIEVFSTKIHPGFNKISFNLKQGLFFVKISNKHFVYKSQLIMNQ